MIRNDHPESRVESRKLFPNGIYIDSHLTKTGQYELLQSLTEQGAFIHAQGWRSRSLGVVLPLSARFWITGDNKIFTHFICHAPLCHGHLCEVRDLVKVDSYGNYLYPSQDEGYELIKTFENKELYFVLGTMKKWPWRWITISIHGF